MKQQMFAQGLSISMYTTAFAALATTVLGLLFAGAVSLGHLLSVRGERGRWTFGSGLAAVGLGGAGVLTAAVLTVMRLSEGVSSPLVIWAPAFGLVSLLALALGV